MNARSVRKRLMRHRHDGRAYLVVRVPLSVTSAPYVRPTFPGFREYAHGHWRNDETGESISITMDESYTGIPVTKNGDRILFGRHRPDGFYEYWEGYRYTPDADGNLIRTLVAEDDVRDERNFNLWYDKLKNGAHPVTDALAKVQGRKGMNIKISHDWIYAYFQYSVKTCYPNRKRAFSAGISRALKMAKKMKINLRLMKGCYE